MRRGSWLRTPIYVLHQAGAWSRVPSRTSAHRVYSAPTDRSTASFATRPSPWTASTPVITPNFCRFKPRVRQDAGLHQQLLASGRQAAGRWNSSSSGSSSIRAIRIKQFYGTLKTQIWIAVSVSAPSSAPRGRLLYVTDPLGALFGKCRTSSTCGRRVQRFANNQPIEFIRANMSAASTKGYRLRCHGVGKLKLSLTDVRAVWSNNRPRE